MRLVAMSIALALTACTDDVDLRVCSQAGYPLTNVKAFDFEGLTLANGDCSEYRPVTYRVYREMCVGATIGDEAIWSCPIDQLGQDPLPGGHWSYYITVLSDSIGSRTLRMRAVED